MSAINFCLVTYDKYPQLTRDDGLLRDKLEALGHTVRPVLWRDPSVVWEQADVVVIRSPWDYMEHVGEFWSFLHRLEGHPRVLNSPALMCWNLDKVYLAELESRGVPIVPTVFVAAGETVDVHEVAQGRGWGEVVVKPTVSGGAWRTQRVGEGCWMEGQSLLESCRDRGMLIQQFIPTITRGEISLVYFGGEFSHAVRKIPRTGEFRIQEEFGGFLHAYTPTREEMMAADRVMANLPEGPAYARVDLVLGETDEVLLGEVEVVEPSLYLAFCPDAAHTFATHLIQRFG